MKKNQAGRIYIGTSNVVIPGNKTTFPEHYRDKSRLHYYASLFNTVELNSSFYKLPKPVTFSKWAAEVTDNFRFAVKVSKEITHAKDLDTDMDHIDKFMQAVKNMGQTKSVLLIQFPGKISIGHFNKVEEILDHFSMYNDKLPWRKAIEFRNSSWYIGETRELLEQHNTALVLHDMPKGRITEPFTGADFIYQRFHGPEAGNYKGSYAPSFLKERAKQMNMWRSEGKDVFAYFNNTIGEAFNNALALQRLTAAKPRHT